MPCRWIASSSASTRQNNQNERQEGALAASCRSVGVIALLVCIRVDSSCDSGWPVFSQPRCLVQRLCWLLFWEMHLRLSSSRSKLMREISSGLLVRLATTLRRVRDDPSHCASAWIFHACCCSSDAVMMVAWCVPPPARGNTIGQALTDNPMPIWIEAEYRSGMISY